jgi:hypothetical protein
MAWPGSAGLGGSRRKLNVVAAYHGGGAAWRKISAISVNVWLAWRQLMAALGAQRRHHQYMLSVINGGGINEASES